MRGVHTVTSADLSNSAKEDISDHVSPVIDHGREMRHEEYARSWYAGVDDVVARGHREAA